jgi:hypothetical protein
MALALIAMGGAPSAQIAKIVDVRTSAEFVDLPIGHAPARGHP